MIQPERITDGQDLLADAKIAGAADRDRDQGVRRRLDLKDGEIVVRIQSDDSCSMLRSVA